MCGITGWAMPVGSTWRPEKELISFWIKALEARGRDACGYFTLTDEEKPRRFWMKGPVTPEVFAKDWINRDVTPVGRIGMLHNRSWTVGPPQFNENNHPLVVGKTVVTHNGGFSDHRKVYDALKIEKPIAQVDSACVPHALDALGVREGLALIVKETPGLAAIAAFTKDGDLLLAKDGRPLFISRMPEGGFAWSSEPDPLFASHSFDEEIGITWDVSRFPMLKWILFDGQTLKIKDTGRFALTIPKFVSATHASGVGFTGTKGATSTRNTGTTTRMRNSPICAWGKCCSPATKSVMDTDGKQKQVCKPHKKEWVRGVKIPTWDDAAAR